LRKIFVSPAWHYSRERKELDSSLKPDVARELKLRNILTHVFSRYRSVARTLQAFHGPITTFASHNNILVLAQSGVYACARGWRAVAIQRLANWTCALGLAFFYRNCMVRNCRVRNCNVWNLSAKSKFSKLSSSLRVKFKKTDFLYESKPKNQI
jgi:hypothetical protein